MEGAKVQDKSLRSQSTGGREKHELTSENTAGEEKLSEDPCQQPAGRGGERVCVG